MNKCDMVASSNIETVVAEYKPIQSGRVNYQSEAELEATLIAQLVGQGYEYITISSEEQLITNLRQCIDSLNNIVLSDNEWRQLSDEYLLVVSDTLRDKTRKVQDDCLYTITLDNGSNKNISILDKKNIHNNRLQVINQYSNATHKGGRNRYDVTIVVNGLPLVHIELKRRGVAIREAFNQIERYSSDSFAANNKIFEYVQIFVISNGADTKYYSNTTRHKHIINKKGSADNDKKNHSFEFTSFWADAGNNLITDLVDFAATFFGRITLLNILTRYCVFTVDRDLLIMRPYQIAATERILSRIACSTNMRELGRKKAGGYVWHTTGSGKTLTSFVTAKLAQKLDVDKVLFVVDRQDLDYQTIREYNKFAEKSADSSPSTRVLASKLDSKDDKVVVTTIQKLDKFVNNEKYNGHSIFTQHVVIIFDECHRSQFGSMHASITKAFRRYHIFGFTGTPIFEENATGDKTLRKTTEYVFGDRLHAYTILDAIRDKNVLPFRIDYLNTVKIKDNIDDHRAISVDTKDVYHSPQYITNNTQYILQHFAQKTYHKDSDSSYMHKVVSNTDSLARDRQGKRGVQEIKNDKQLTGFNSIFAVDSIEASKLYYSEFKRQQEGLDDGQRLTIALIYSYSNNQDSADVDIDNSKLDESDRAFLQLAISDYNARFGTTWDTSDDKFDGYYKDLSMRVKNRDIDILVVVNMFLTGFDATTLNTLWVDKDMRHHGLLQAFSRTNRILNSIKRFGNIICFRDLRDNTKEAILLFCDKELSGVVILPTFDELYTGYKAPDGSYQEGYKELIAMLQKQFTTRDDIFLSMTTRCDFVQLFGKILRLRNTLRSFDEFVSDPSVAILSQAQYQDYISYYNDIKDELKSGSTTGGEEGDEPADGGVFDGLVFETELIAQDEVNIDYILRLIADHKDRESERDNERQAEGLTNIYRLINSSPSLRNKKDLIEEFIDSITADNDVLQEWPLFLANCQKRDIDIIISKHNLNRDKAIDYVRRALREGRMTKEGLGFDSILPSNRNLFDKNDHAISNNIFADLETFYNKYDGIELFDNVA